MFDSSVMAPAPVRLRNYQARAASRVFGEFDAGRKSTLLVMATGTGKTVVFGTVARGVIEDEGGRVLVLAHRDELIRQAADSLAALGVEAAIEKSEENARCGLFEDPRCVIASVQTLRGKRLQSWPRDYFKLIIRDECHHSTSDSDRAIIDHFRPDWHLGVTATPDRLDGENLGQVYQSVAYEYSLAQAIRDGYLCRLQVVRCETSVDLRDIRTTGGDLSQGDVERAIRPHVEELANATRKEIGHRRSIVFTPDVGSGQAFATALSSLGIPAESIHGDSQDRAEILSGFRHGRYQALANCLDEATELLTRRGWVGIDGIRDDDITASVDPFNREVRWEPILRVVRRDRDRAECMVMIKNQTLDIRVTDSHRMMYRTRGAIGWKFAEAETLVGVSSSYQIPLAGYGNDVSPDIDGAKSVRELTDDECRFIGLWIADGSIDRTGGHRGVTIGQSGIYVEANEEIRRILTSCGFDWRHCQSRNSKSAHWQHRYSVPKGSIGGQLSRKGFARLEAYLDKDFSQSLRGLSREQLLCLIEGLWLGDGTKQQYRKLRYDVRRSWSIVNTNKVMLDRLQAIAVTRGLACNILGPRDNGPLSTKSIYTITLRDRADVTTNNKSVPTSGGNPATLETAWKAERVWCVTNQTGTIITRRNGKVAVMGQCALLTEGFDAPFVSAVVLARPTQSRALYSQAVGRGTRIFPRKSDCLIVDFAWLTGKHKLVQPTELFDTTEMSSEVQELAVEWIDRGKEPDLMLAIERAEAEVKRRQTLRIKVRERDVRYHRVSYDPMAVMDVLGMGMKMESDSALRCRATDRQVAALEKFGVSGAKEMSKRRAGLMLDRVIGRMQKGLATVKQVSWLIANGVDPDEARSISRDEASARLDMLFGKRVR